MRVDSFDQRRSICEGQCDWIHSRLQKHWGKFLSYPVSEEVSKFSLQKVLNQEQYWDSFEPMFSYLD